MKTFYLLSELNIKLVPAAYTERKAHAEAGSGGPAALLPCCSVARVYYKPASGLNVKINLLPVHFCSLASLFSSQLAYFMLHE